MTKSPLSALVALAAASVLATGCGFKSGSSGPLAPTAPSTPSATVNNNSNPSSTPSLVGQWSSTSLAALPAPSSCSAFQYQINSQTTSSIAGTFSATCAGGVQISGNATGQLNGTAVIIAITGNAMIAGVLPCAFSLSGNGDVEDNGNTLRLPYSGTTCFGPVSGTEVLHRPQAPAPPAPTPTPTPAPTPDPPPPPPSSSGPNDSIDMRQAGIYNSPQDLGYWAVTAKITSVVFTGDAFLVDFDKRTGGDRWPDVPFGDGGSLEYTLGMCLNINGQWDCSAVVQFWYGRDLHASAPPSQIASAWFYDSRWGPLTGRQPADGETVGIFVCAGDCRNKLVGDGSIVHERSNVQFVTWSNGAGPSYTFSSGSPVMLKRKR